MATLLAPGTYAILNDDRSFQRTVTFEKPTETKTGRVLPIVVTAQPAFNAATQKVTQSGWKVNAANVETVWEIVLLTQRELDSISQTQEAALLRPAIALFKAGTATNAQVQRAIAYLLKQLIE